MSQRRSAIEAADIRGICLTGSGTLSAPERRQWDRAAYATAGRLYSAPMHIYGMGHAAGGSAGRQGHGAVRSASVPEKLQSVAYRTCFTRSVYANH